MKIMYGLYEFVNYKVTKGGDFQYNTLNINNKVIKDYRITSFNTSYFL